MPPLIQDSPKTTAPWNIRKFGVFLFSFQLLFTILFAVFVEYDWDALPASTRVLKQQVEHPIEITAQITNRTIPRKLQITEFQPNDSRLMQEKYPFQDYFPMYMDIQVMIFFAFGLLIACFKRYGYSSISIAFVLGAFVVQWAILVHGFFDLHDGKIKLSIISLISADFTIAAVLISTCVVLGTLSPVQYLILALFEVVFYALNEWICLKMLMVVDVGGSIYLHTFAAYFGLAVSVVINRSKSWTEDMAKLKFGSKINEILAMIGTVFLFIYWPSFNSVFAPADFQNRAAINTGISLIASCMGAFASSALLSKDKFSMTVIQNGILAGGVAVGAVADLMIQPFAALLIGFTAGSLTVAGFLWINPILEKKLKLVDMCGVQYLHGLPGIFGGLISAVVCGVANQTTYGSSFWEAFPAAIPAGASAEFAALKMQFSKIEPGKGRSQLEQTAFQLLALLMSVLLALVSGLCCGVVLKTKVFDPLKPFEMVNDELMWRMPTELSVDEEADVREALEKLEKIMANRKEVIGNTTIKDQLRGLEACLKS